MSHDTPNPAQQPPAESFRGRLNQLLKRIEGVHVGPIVLRPKNKIELVFLLVVAGFVLTTPYVVVRMMHKLESPPLLKPGPIEVFLPDPSKYSDGAFYQDGVVQKRGFDKGIEDAELLPRRLEVEFQAMRQEESPDELLNRMKKLYENKNATYFVMTMSRMVTTLHKRFKEWHDECVHDSKERVPILIATVASAPGVADASAGIVRWYVRSDEETAILASYMRWKLAVTDAVVFYITRHSGQEDDPYGTRGRDLFQERFTKLGGHVESFSFTAATAKEEVRSFLKRYSSKGFQAPRKVGVFVIGYGDAFKEIMSGLIANGFEGPVTCTSTLTEPEWQPRDTKADGRIFSVLPRLKDSPGSLRGDDRNVVFFFAKDTLFHVLELTALDSDSKTFVGRWETRGESHMLDHDYLADGDAIIRVEVVGSDKWR